MKNKKYNILNLSSIERKKINIDLIASSIIFRERHKLPIKESLLKYKKNKFFLERLYFFREISKKYFYLK